MEAGEIARFLVTMQRTYALESSRAVCGISHTDLIRE